jgi:hypothetical protein
LSKKRLEANLLKSQPSSIEVPEEKLDNSRYGLDVTGATRLSKISERSDPLTNSNAKSQTRKSGSVDQREITSKMRNFWKLNINIDDLSDMAQLGTPMPIEQITWSQSPIRVGDN